MKAGTVALGARGAARVRAGQPWVYRSDVNAALPGGRDDLQVLDERGRPLGSALWADSPAPIALRVYARGERHVGFDEVLEERLRAAAGLRARLFGAGAAVCRLVHAEADFLPGLFVDRYGDAAVLQSGTAAVDRREAQIAATLARMLGLRLVVARDDGSIRDHEGLGRRKGVVWGGGETRVSYAEGAARFAVDLLEDAKTGGFLDQRENHARVAEIAFGESLDAFTYHGGFALAMAPRAASVLAFDENPLAVARAVENARASGLANVEARAADAFTELRTLESAGRRFQTVVIDPPALGKRKGPVDQALRAYKELNLRAFRITDRDGWLVTCSCSGKITAELFEQMLVEAARDARREAAIIERRGAGRDHPALLGVPETDYLKCFVIRLG